MNNDTISRKMAIDALNKLADIKYTHMPYYGYYLGALHDAADDIKALPSVEELKSEARDTAYLEGYTAGQEAQPERQLITWLLDEIWDDDAWDLNCGAFPEILCRKLVKLGYVAEEGGTYVRIDQQKIGN